MEQKELDEWRKWREKMKNKPLRFGIRDDIEEIIKKENIDRSHFYEFSKFDYGDIIRKFYFAFSDRKNYSPSQISLSYNLMHFRSELKTEYIDCFFRTYDWTEYLKSIKNAIPDSKQKLFLILCEGWVYEGYADEMFSVLNETSCIKDFYIVSAKFDWFIAVSDMEDSATIYKC